MSTDSQLAAELENIASDWEWARRNEIEHAQVYLSRLAYKVEANLPAIVRALRAPPPPSASHPVQPADQDALAVALDQLVTQHFPAAGGELRWNLGRLAEASARLAQPELLAERDALASDLHKLALFHASGGHEVAWEEVDEIVATAIARRQESKP